MVTFQHKKTFLLSFGGLTILGSFMLHACDAPKDTMANRFDKNKGRVAYQLVALAVAEKINKGDGTLRNAANIAASEVAADLITKDAEKMERKDLVSMLLGAATKTSIAFSLEKQANWADWALSKILFREIHPCANFVQCNNKNCSGLCNECTQRKNVITQTEKVVGGFVVSWLQSLAKSND